MKTKIWVSLLLASVVVAAASPKSKAPPRPRYRVFELPTLPGTSNSFARSINNRGDILGSSKTKDGAYHVFLFTHGEVFDLGLELEPSHFRGFSINDSGQIVAPVASAFYTYLNVQPPPPGYGSPYGFTVNNAGVVAGFAQTVSPWPNTRTHAEGFLYQNGVFHWIAPLEPYGQTAVYQVNNRGQAAGFATTNGFEQAMLYANGQAIILGALQDGDHARATALNDLGHAVGTSSREIEYAQLEIEGFFFRDGMTKLAGLPGLPFCDPRAINNYDEIVGDCSDFSAINRGFFQSDDRFYDLNELIPRRSGIIESASDINESGWVVGSMRTRQGASRAVLLKPIGVWKHWRATHAP